MNKLFPWLCVVCAAMMAGCVGNSFSMKDIHGVQPGMTTNEVRALVSEPLYILPHYDGTESWWWIHDNGFRKKTASITFRDGKVVEVPK